MIIIINEQCPSVGFSPHISLNTVFLQGNATCKAPHSCLKSKLRSVCDYFAGFLPTTTPLSIFLSIIYTGIGLSTHFSCFYLRNSTFTDPDCGNTRLSRFFSRCSFINNLDTCLAMISDLAVLELERANLVQTPCSM